MSCLLLLSFFEHFPIYSTGHFPAISDDLVNSYHLLLCCLDWFYANALMGGRKDLLNPSFEGKIFFPQFKKAMLKSFSYSYVKYLKMERGISDNH